MIRQRILIITDSLGMPREETTISQTWVDRCSIRLCECGHMVNQQLYRNLTTDTVREKSQDYIARQEAGVLIFQVGICDCVRRAMGAWQLNFMNLLTALHVPFIPGFFHRFYAKNHYFFTKNSNKHYVSISDFEKNYRLFISLARKSVPDCKIIFLAMAPAGPGLIRSTCNAQNDIDAYNRVLKTVSEECHVRFINPYEGYSGDVVTIGDGHHLSEAGHTLVYKAVCRELETFGCLYPLDEPIPPLD